MRMHLVGACDLVDRLRPANASSATFAFNSALNTFRCIARLRLVMQF